MSDIYNALAGLNQGVSVGMGLLLLLCIGHLIYRLRFTVFEERVMVALMALFLVFSISDRNGEALLITALLGDNEADLLGRVTIVCRAGLGLVAWGWSLYVLIWVWGKRWAREQL